jgi:hypothetical protein
MSNWTAADLDRIGSADELEITTQRADGSLRPYVPIWVVRAGHELFVRSWHGQAEPDEEIDWAPGQIRPVRRHLRRTHDRQGRQGRHRPAHGPLNRIPEGKPPDDRQRASQRTLGRAEDVRRLRTRTGARHAEQLTYHLQLAKDNGATEEELIEAITHLAFYAGWPKAMSAARHVFRSN